MNHLNALLCILVHLLGTTVHGVLRVVVHDRVGEHQQDVAAELLEVLHLARLDEGTQRLQIHWLFDDIMVAGHLRLADRTLEEVGMPVGANVLEQCEQHLLGNGLGGRVVARTQKQPVLAHAVHRRRGRGTANPGESMHINDVSDMHKFEGQVPNHGMS